MSVDDDSGALLLIGGEVAVVVGIEEAQNLAKSLFALVVGKYLSIDTRGVTVAKVGGKLHFRMPRVVLLNKAADKADNDCLLGCLFVDFFADLFVHYGFRFFPRSVLNRRARNVFQR